MNKFLLVPIIVAFSVVSTIQIAYSQNLVENATNAVNSTAQNISEKVNSTAQGNNTQDIVDKISDAGVTILNGSADVIGNLSGEIKEGIQ